jgi:hypothetical protein
LSDTTPARNRTFKKERRAAKPDAIQWNGLARWSVRNGRPLIFNNPRPRTSIAQWARLRRDEPVRLSVKLQLPVQFK